nr:MULTISPECIES: zinc metalloprotease HtpX [unclassified Helicobacter]
MSDTKKRHQAKGEPMNFDSILQKNKIKTYAVLCVYIAIFALIGLLVDIIRIDAPSLEYGFYALLSLREFPLITTIAALVACAVIWYSLSRFDVIMLKGDEYELIPESGHLAPLQAFVRNAFDDVLSRAGFSHAPRLYLIHAPYMNAFASGWSEQNSLVAITTELAKNLDERELKAVLAHEVSHIRHGDIRLTMSVGILSNILLLICNSAAWLFMGDRRNDGAQKARSILLVLQFVLPLLTMWLQMFLSRSREYMADAGSAYLMHNPDPIISALKKISNNYTSHDFSQVDNNPTRKAAYIFEMGDMFSTHPSLENRIKSLYGR